MHHTDVVYSKFLMQGTGLRNEKGIPFHTQALSLFCSQCQSQGADTQTAAQLQNPGGFKVKCQSVQFIKPWWLVQGPPGKGSQVLSALSAFIAEGIWRNQIFAAGIFGPGIPDRVKIIIPVVGVENRFHQLKKEGGVYPMACVSLQIILAINPDSFEYTLHIRHEYI
jgi:hypothetical protein